MASARISFSVNSWNDFGMCKSKRSLRLCIWGKRLARARGAVGMRSRASGVARLEAVPAFYAYSRLFVRLFTFYGRAMPDAQERIYRATRADHLTARREAHPSYGGCQAWIVGAGDYFIFLMRRSRAICGDAPPEPLFSLRPKATLFFKAAQHRCEEAFCQLNIEVSSLQVLSEFNSWTVQPPIRSWS